MAEARAFRPAAHSGYGALEPLTDVECRRLLASAAIGRLGFTDGAMPAIVPVSFTLRDDSALIPARRGSDLAHAVRGAVVVLQVDSFRDAAGPGWSVTIVGPSHLITAPVPDPRDEEHCYIAVLLGLLHGWRSGPAVPR